MHLPQPLDPMPPHLGRHLAKDQRLALVRERLLRNLELQIHVLVREVPEEDVERLLRPPRDPLPKEVQHGVFQR